MCRATIALATMLLAGVAAAQVASDRSAAPSAPWVGSAKAERPVLGYRYAELNGAQRAVLRRRVRLPLDLLASAGSPQALKSGVEVAPLPPLDRPMIAADAGPSGGDGSDPFAAEGGASVSFKSDPMGALGALLGATADAESDAVEAATDFSPVAEDPADDPFAQDSTAAEVAPADDSGDDFSFGDDDPFADF